MPPSPVRGSQRLIVARASEKRSRGQAHGQGEISAEGYFLRRDQASEKSRLAICRSLRDRAAGAGR